MTIELTSEESKVINNLHIKYPDFFESETEIDDFITASRSAVTKQGFTWENSKRSMSFSSYRGLQKAVVTVSTGESSSTSRLL